MQCDIPHEITKIGWCFADFYNWNRVRIRYCDGSSFTGDVEAVDPVSLRYPPSIVKYIASLLPIKLVINVHSLYLYVVYLSDQATNLHFRGARVWRAIIDDLLEKGMKNAENVCPIM